MTAFLSRVYTDRPDYADFDPPRKFLAKIAKERLWEPWPDNWP